jgi:MSHA biogenesis protein MshE
MSGLDIAEKRLPQDGRFHLRVADRPIDVRISTMPTAWGESVVMRLLDQSGDQLSLDQIGMPPEMLVRFRRLAQRPHGLLLVTGPTGSGKTTTLYAALRELNVAERKIVTVEDPVEYRLPRVQQVQVNPKIQLTFAGVLRSVLRHDPDVVMIGEMRDNETAQIGLRAALTGHLVLSTLHTNDAISSSIRLADMGVDGYLVASALRGIVAQRLVRRLCSNCREPASLSPGEHAWLASHSPEDLGSQFQRGAGCSDCNRIGHRGRVGVYELLELDTDAADALRRGDHGEYERVARASRGFRSLTEAALDLARKGVTSLPEVLRVAEQGEDEPIPGGAVAASSAGR